ncbi:MAG: hypothetical protein OMM_14990, partial [Candidatus Magnetoglobus multicellularis str. Araruama]
MAITSVTISDEDAGNEPIRLTIVSEHGLIEAEGFAATKQLTPSDANLISMNVLLKSLTFTPDEGYTGPANIQIAVN